MASWLKLMKALRMTAAVDAFLPETFDSPMAEVLSAAKHTKKARAAESGIRWGDQIE